MEDVTSGALLDAVRGVHWPARRVTRGALHGAHRSRRVGSSPEFSEYRPYQQGDDPSRIDWRLFGRTERVAIRLAHDDSSLRTGVLLDASASMSWPETRSKWDCARFVALGLCAVAFADGDPVALAVSSEDPIVVPPSTRRDSVARIRAVLARAQAAGDRPLSTLMPALRNCRRIALVSDFLGDAERMLDRAKELLAAGREVYAVHVVADEEVDPGAMGIVVDPENAALRRTLDAEQLASYRERFAAWRSALSDQWLKAGAAYHAVLTSEGPARIVRRVTRPTGPALQ